MSNKPKNKVDHIIDRAKNSRLIAPIIVGVMVITAIATFTDAVAKITNFVSSWTNNDQVLTIEYQVENPTNDNIEIEPFSYFYLISSTVKCSIDDDPSGRLSLKPEGENDTGSDYEIVPDIPKTFVAEFTLLSGYEELLKLGDMDTCFVLQVIKPKDYKRTYIKRVPFRKENINDLSLPFTIDNVRPIIILVADFDGPEPQKYGVTDAVLENLYQTLSSFADVQIEALGRPITQREGSTVARSEGEKHNASIVIWGWYRTPGAVVPLSVNFEVLRLRSYSELLGPTARRNTSRAFPVAALESFSLQTQLSSEMAYLSLFTVGMTRYAAKDWDGAINSFQQAIDEVEIREEPLFEKQEELYLLMAQAYRFKGDFEMAFDNLDQALSLNPEYARAFIERGNIYYDQAQGLSNETELEVRLRKAHFEYYERALNAKDQPSDAFIKEKVYVNIGNVFVLLAQKKETNKSELFDQAIDHYNQVVTQYERRQNEQLKEISATAYCGLGFAYENQNNDSEQAANAYQQCKELTSNAELKSMAETQLENLNNK